MAAIDTKMAALECQKLAEATEKKILAEEISAILKTVDRIYRRDKTRFGKLIVWVNTVNRTGWPNEIVLEALRALEEKEKKGEKVDAWWPYLFATMRRLRTRAIEDENERLKHGDLNRVSAILGECLRRSQEMNLDGEHFDDA